MGKKFLFLFLVGVAVFVCASTSYAGWELYDDFNIGTEFNTEKWSKDESSGTITIENQKAKFVLADGNPNDSLYLHFIQNAGTIAGMKATVNVVSCTGDGRARMVGYAGRDGIDHLWTGIQLQNAYERIYTNADLEGPAPDYEMKDSYHYSEFERPITIVGETYTITMMFNDDNITYEVDGLGKITYEYVSAMESPTSIFRAIGCRSTNGDGPCTIYFDNVYVYRP